MQNFFADVKPHFNLRKPKSKKATPIYLVVFIGGKQYKLTTGVKVYPDQWSKSKQLATISNTNSRLDNKNNQLANKRLSEISGYYSDFIDYLCNQDETPTNIVEVLKSYIYKDMESKQNISIDVARTIKAAFSYYYTYIHKSKESTKEQAQYQLNVFLAFIKDKGLTKDLSVFSQTGLNNYKAFLIDEGKVGNSRINQLCQLIERLINNVLAVNNEYQKYHIGQVKYVKIEDKRKQDEICRFPLYDSEIQAIKDCKTLTDIEKEYRTIFLLQCASGQRVSDILHILKGEYEQANNVITLQTIKKGTYAQIRITPEIEQYLKEVAQLEHINVNNFLTDKYNKAIKDICQKAGLTRVIKWKDAKGKMQSNPLWQVVVSHDARHTFITNKVKEGVPYDTLCLMTGHTDDRMIKEVYANLTKEDKRDKVASYYESHKEQATGEQVKSNPDISLKEVLDFMKPDGTISVYEFDTDLIREDSLEDSNFISKYELKQSDIDFIGKTNTTFEVGYHTLKMIKQISRLLERGLLVCTHKGKDYPDQLNGITIKDKYSD